MPDEDCFSADFFAGQRTYGTKLPDASGRPIWPGQAQQARSLNSARPRPIHERFQSLVNEDYGHFAGNTSTRSDTKIQLNAPLHFPRHSCEPKPLISKRALRPSYGNRAAKLATPVWRKHKEYRYLVLMGPIPRTNGATQTASSARNCYCRRARDQAASIA